MENKKKRSKSVLAFAILFCLLGSLALVVFSGFIVNRDSLDVFQKTIETSVNDTNKSFDQGYAEVMEAQSEWFIKLQESGNIEKYKERFSFWRAQVVKKGDFYLKINPSFQTSGLVILFVGGLSSLIAGFGLFKLKKWAIKVTFLSLFFGLIYYGHMLAALYFPLDIIQTISRAIMDLNALFKYVEPGVAESIWPGKYPVLRHYLIGIPCIYANLFFIALFAGARLYFRREKIRSQFE